MVSSQKMLALVKCYLILPHLIFSTTLLGSSSGYFIDEVAGAQWVKCIAHSTEPLDVKLRIKTRAPVLKGDTFTLSTAFLPQNLEQTRFLHEAHRNISLREVGPH